MCVSLACECVNEYIRVSVWRVSAVMDMSVSLAGECFHEYVCVSVCHVSVLINMSVCWCVGLTVLLSMHIREFGM